MRRPHRRAARLAPERPVPVTRLAPERPVPVTRLARRRSDEGSASVLVLAVAGALVALAVALGLIVQATVGRARAQTAADLAAIAAAQLAQRAALAEPGAGDPCARAAEVAEHNGTALVRCDEVASGVVTVEIAVRTPGGAAHASARAGPRPP